MSYGFYLGCAAHGGEGNAAGLSFRPDKPEWKKSDAAGRRAPDNCLACDDYYEWWFTVQNGTIQKYNLSNWSWDPSLGSGMNCYDESHGHIAGKGAYKGWRRCIELMGRLKAAKKDLFIQGFYGTKNFGLWGLKHVDQHEVYNEPFGEQVQPGAVDGYARIKGDHGFIFLFNGNPRSSEIAFEVGDEINLQVKGQYQFTELYPSEKGKRVLDNDGKSIFALGQTARITVPANSCFLFELKKVDQRALPVLLGAQGTLDQRGDALEIAGISGKPGQRMPVRVRLFNPGAVKSVTVNGVQQPFSASEEELCLDLEFAGEKYVRELDVCARADGKRFDFPHHTAQPELKLTTRFTLNADVRQLLEKARPKNFAEMDVKIAGWQMPESKRNPSYSYHNFICERPERLWLVIPFLSQTGVDVEINGEKVDMLRWDGPSSSAFADLTDRVKYGNENSITLSIKGMAPNRFMGPFLLYPDESATDRVLPTPGQADNAILYTHALVPVPPPRYRKGEGPKLVEAKMMSNVTLREGTELRVKVDLPPEKLRRVMFFESGFGWMGQHNLGYSREAQCWTAGVTPGNRASIQENEYVYVWAEGADGLRSDYYPVKVGWDFK
jgi:hypothetical protein